MALVALLGPLAVPVLKDFLPEVESLAFMNFRDGVQQAVPCVVSRSDYTGEDSLEITVPAQYADTVTRPLLAYEDVKPADLGSRNKSEA